MRPCPLCAEQIQEAAIKCRHCGETIPAVRVRPQRPAPPPKPPKAKDHPDFAKFSALAFLLPMVGFIVGIVYLCKSDPLDKKLGEHALVTSIFATMFWSVAYVWYLRKMIG